MHILFSPQTISEIMSSFFSSGVVGDVTNNLLYDAVELAKEAMTKTVDFIGFHVTISCSVKIGHFPLPLSSAR